MRGCILSLFLVAFAWATAANAQADIDLNTAQQGPYFLVV